MNGSSTADSPGVDPWTRLALTDTERQVRHADRMAEELHRLGERFDAATGVGRRDRVLDIGCGTGESSREAGRCATAGSVLGVDILASVIERARRLTEQAGLRNVSYLQADAQAHRFPPQRFDVGISRFGAMFFTDLVAALTNIGHALHPGARLVLMVWQSRDRNEWYTMVREAFGTEVSGRTSDAGADDPFSLADPATTTSALAAAGFTDVDFTEVRQPVYYGPDTAVASDFVASMRHTQELLATVNLATAERVRQRLRVALAERDTGNGVYVGARAWIVTARPAWAASRGR